MVVTIYCNFRDYCEEAMRRYWLYTKGAKYTRETLRLIEENAYPKIGSLCIGNVKTSDINALLYNIVSQKGISEAYKTRRILLKVFNYAQEHRIVGRDNPVDGAIDFPAPAKLLRFFNKEEEAKIFAASKIVINGIAAKIALKYGLSDKRMLAVRAEDLDRDKMMVNITKEVCGYRGLFVNPLASDSQHIYVDAQGMMDFDTLVKSRIKKDQIQYLEYGMRCQTGIRDFSLELCKQTFIMDAVNSGATPIDLRAYYSTKGSSDFFSYEHHRGEEAPDERIYQYINEQI